MRKLALLSALALASSSALASQPAGVPPDYIEPALPQAAAAGVPPDYAEPASKQPAGIPPDWTEPAAAQKAPGVPPDYTEKAPEAPRKVSPVPPDYQPGKTVRGVREDLLPSSAQMPLEDQLQLLKRNQEDIEAKRAARQKLESLPAVLPEKEEARPVYTGPGS